MVLRKVSGLISCNKERFTHKMRINLLDKFFTYFFYILVFYFRLTAFDFCGTKGTSSMRYMGNLLYLSNYFFRDCSKKSSFVDLKIHPPNVLHSRNKEAKNFSK